MEEEIIKLEDAENISLIFGVFDNNITMIESKYNVKIYNRNSDIKLVGEGESIKKVTNIINTLLLLAKNGREINSQIINYVIELEAEGNIKQINDINEEVICVTAKGKQIKPKTLGQKTYVDKIKNNTIVVGVGPAGTGKTYLAVAMAVKAFRNNDVEKIILTRPAVEAGEKLGFLPGDLQDKVDPYLRPLYDGLLEMLDGDSFQKYQQRGNIEVAPLAYMRGRTLDNSFIILDEAQNTSKEQMKMFLTRLGYNSKIVITGDITQIDIPNKTDSGLIQAIKILKNIQDIYIMKFSRKDVVRHPLVQSIIKAYDDFYKGGKY